MIDRRIFPLLALSVVAAAPAFGRDASTGLKLEHAWSRPTAAGAVAAVGYLGIVNAGRQADRLLGGSTPAAARIEIHRSTLVGGVMRMREVEGGVDLPAGGTVELSPGGYHLMFVAPKRAFRAGDRIPATLDFARAGKVRVTFVVGAAPPGSAAPAMAMPM